MSAFAKRLQQRTSCPRVASARASAAAAFELGGLPGALRLLTVRQLLGLERSPAAAAEERELLRVAITTGRSSKAVQAALKAQAAAAGERRQQLLQQRLEQERQRRERRPQLRITAAPPPQPVAAAEAVASPELNVDAAAGGIAPCRTPRRRGGNPTGSAPADGEVGQRLGRKIDKLLAELRQGDAAPVTAAAAEPAEVLAEAPPEPIPDALQPATPPAAPALYAEVQAAAEQGQLEPAPAEPAQQPQMPVVLTLEREAAPAAAPASAWATIAAAVPAEAARLEAMAVLHQQLLELPAGSGGRVELTAGQAQTLLLALLA